VDSACTRATYRIQEKSRFELKENTELFKWKCHMFIYIQNCFMSC